MRAVRIWRERTTLVSYCTRRGKLGDPRMVSVSTVGRRGLKRVVTKMRDGRGRKRMPWVVSLQEDLVQEFERICKVGIKFSATMLTSMAKDLVRTSQNGAYDALMISGRLENPIVDLVTARWIQVFIYRFNTKGRSQSGKLQIFPEAQARIEQRVAFFLGTVARELMSRALKEDDIENADETHFVVNMDNGRTLAFRGDVAIRYADVTSECDGMKMMVRVSDGAGAKLENPFMVLRNSNAFYAIRGVPDDIPAVNYRTGPKGWIDKRVITQWVRERRLIGPLPSGPRRELFMNNCSSHGKTPELYQALSDIFTELRFSPANATHWIQPADSFVI